MPGRTQPPPGNGHERSQPWERASGYAGPQSVAETVMSTLRTAEMYAGPSVLERTMENLPSERFAKQIEGIGAVGRFAEQMQAMGSVGRVVKQIEELRRVSDVGLGKGLAGHLERGLRYRQVDKRRGCSRHRAEHQGGSERWRSLG